MYSVVVTMPSGEVFKFEMENISEVIKYVEHKHPGFAKLEAKSPNSFISWGRRREGISER